MPRRRNQTHSVPFREEAVRQAREARKPLTKPADVKRAYANASIVGENRVVFNIGGNKYRLIVAVNYPYRMCYIRFVGTHKAYDRIDAGTV